MHGVCVCNEKIWNQQNVLLAQACPNVESLLNTENTNTSSYLYQTTHLGSHIQSLASLLRTFGVARFLSLKTLCLSKYLVQR